MKDRDERWDAPLTQQQWDTAAWMFRDDYDTTVKRIAAAAPPLNDAQRDKLATLLNDGK